MNLIIVVILILIFKFSIFTKTTYLFSVILNILIVFATLLLNEQIILKLGKFKSFKSNKKKIMTGIGTLIICSSIILLFLNHIEATLNTNALNKIRSLVISIEITIPTENRDPNFKNMTMGTRNYMWIESNNSEHYKLDSGDSFYHEQVATNTHKIHLIYRPAKAEELYGKKIKTLESIKKLYFNFEGIINLCTPNTKHLASSTWDMNLSLNSIIVGKYSNIDIVPKERGNNKIFTLNVSRLFKNIENRYDEIQKK